MPIKMSSKTADGLRKADVSYRQWMDSNWVLCQFILRAIGPASGYGLRVKITHPEASNIRQYIGDFERLVCRSPVPLHGPLVVKHVEANGHGKGFQRSYYVDEDHTIYFRDNPDRGVVWHEMGHWLEHTTPGLQGAVEGYLHHRTANDVPKRLLGPCRPGYNLVEMAKMDAFIDPYCGKLYKEGGTEVLSMGIQLLEEDPAELWNQDRGLMYLTLGAISFARGG